MLMPVAFMAVSSLRTMSVNSSKKVNTSAKIKNVASTMPRYMAKSRRIMSSRMSGNLALKRLR